VYAAVPVIYFISAAVIFPASLDFPTLPQFQVIQFQTYVIFVTIIIIIIIMNSERLSVVLLKVKLVFQSFPRSPYVSPRFRLIPQCLFWHSLTVHSL